MINILKSIFLKIKTMLRVFSIGNPICKKMVTIGNTYSDFNAHKSIPKIIWLYWESQESNELVDFCVYNLKKTLPEFEIKFLDSSNVKEYINIPKEITSKNLKKAVYADYIRLSLLKKFGGVWLDASIILIENLDWILNELKTETFLFYSDDCSISKKKPIVENWFIISSENNQFISDWLEEFEKCLLSNDPSSYYLEYKGKKDVIQNIPNTNYLMCYISAIIVLNNIGNTNKYSITCQNSGSSGHFFNYKLFSDSFFIAVVNLLINKKYIYNPKLIKYTSSTRKYMDIFIRNKFYSKKSILSKKLNDYYNRNFSE